ncbi:MAG: adenosylmethionine decarboxylase [Rhodospirillales bacterium]|nr:adenosylmethionine decarboxylase [Rhodospirillales bacterium]
MPRDDIALSRLGTAADVFQSESHEDKSVQTNATVIPFPSQEGRLDHFIQRDGMCFAGTHLIIDVWDAANLDDIDHIEATLKECVTVAGATLLHCHLHRFNPEGVSGVLVLAESHISIHTWPEMGYAALDVFMCGDSRPHEAIAVLKRGFATQNVTVQDLHRGRVS